MRSAASTSTGRAGRSTASPCRARLYERTPSTLTAEYAGGDLHLLPAGTGKGVAREPHVEHALVDGGRAHDPPLGVVGVGLGTEGDIGDVALGVLRDEAEQARRLADAEHHDARGERIERPGVADATLAQSAAAHAHDVVGGAPHRLVDGKQEIQR